MHDPKLCADFSSDCLVLEFIQRNQGVQMGLKTLTMDKEKMRGDRSEYVAKIEEIGIKPAINPLNFEQ